VRSIAIGAWVKLRPMVGGDGADWQEQSHTTANPPW
jgi:hypothetical protein